ncbi:PQQ-binding-like beta-propeller repeat protein [Streptomyces sp. NPDC049627]|uniref:outer membrane protein assembly factor BamB family protein n=1 Tax=Streptomyces sp. NPDC049627 TaxID=3365595 RepID=UPI0037B0A777
MARVPRGVVDARGRQAVVHDHEGALMALDLENGALLWRHGPSLRPCALLAGSVVALRMSPSPTLVVVVLDAATGQDRWTSEPVDLPPWARCTLDDTRGFTLRTEAADDAVVLRWVVRTWYRGGAAPSAGVLEESRRAAHGALRVGLAGSPSLEVLREAEAEAEAWAGAGAEAEALAETADADVPPPVPPAASSDRQSAVLDQSLVGDKRMELLLLPDSGAVVLRAVDPRTGTLAWEVELDRATPRRAPRLRP